LFVRASTGSRTAHLRRADAEEVITAFHAGTATRGMGGDDGPYGYERYLRRKIVYLSHD
jgi:hypothetical protein